jgi:alkanesulfonate monooxygenase SsuD/methylene tetrahydromethanopterin reductase-like flavin-dependent oxidoreductase (luciferase family)
LLRTLLQLSEDRVGLNIGEGTGPEMAEATGDRERDDDIDFVGEGVLVTVRE